MNGNWLIRTNIRVIARNLSGVIIDVVEIKNLITTVGKNLIRDGLNNVATISDIMIKYVEVGTGNTAPVVADTTLDTFLFRKVMTSRSTPSDGVTKCIVYIAPSEAVAALKEIGWWAGASAGGAEASGVMVSRILYTRNKTSLESLQIERLDSISEVT